MVKNFKGGSKHKKFARKSTKGGNVEFTGKLRKSEQYEEIYACVTKIFGNGRVEIMCNDGEVRHCVIRNKFRGKGKRDNEVVLGSVLLVGERPWATKNDNKADVCDLLYVYSNSEVNKLKTESGINIGLLQSGNKSVFNKETEVEFFDKGMPEMSESEDDSDDSNNSSQSSEKSQKDKIQTINDEDEIIDVDEI